MRRYPQLTRFPSETQNMRSSVGEVVGKNPNNSDAALAKRRFTASSITLRLRQQRLRLGNNGRSRAHSPGFAFFGTPAVRRELYRLRNIVATATGRSAV
jgi:hypothetical protein